MKTVGVVIFPNVQILDAAGPIGAFEVADRHVPGSYRIRVLADAAGPVRTSAGVDMLAEAFDDAPLDTLVVAGGEGTRSVSPVLIAWVKAAARRARRTTSVCSGAYVLAEAGLLDGLRATTHWSRTDDFARRYPKVRLEPDRIYIREGDIWTSAGITAGIDLALALVADDLGEAVSRATAQHLVVHQRRPGGQSQFSALVELGGPTGRFAALMDWMRVNLSDPLTVERLAREAAMSPRNFARAFTAETGLTPAKAVERLRLEAARARIEGSAEPIDRVALTAGFGDPERMRRAFLRAFGQPPQALRRAART